MKVFVVKIACMHGTNEFHTVRKCPLGKQPQGLFASLPAGLSGSLILGKIWLIIGFPPLASRSGRETKWPRQDRGKLHERERLCFHSARTRSPRTSLIRTKNARRTV